MKCDFYLEYVHINRLGACKYLAEDDLSGSILSIKCYEQGCFNFKETFYRDDLFQCDMGGYLQIIDKNKLNNFSNDDLKRMNPKPFIRN